MSLHISNFEVSNLHGCRSIRLNLRDNKLILVGENGTGKTTIINLLYYFLSRQWSRLSNYKFDYIKAEINGEVLTLTQEMLSISTVNRKQARFIQESIRIKWNELLSSTNISKEQTDLDKNDLELLRQAAKQAGIPTSRLYSYLTTIDKEQIALFEKQQELSNKLKEVVQEQILYLPTYRRIEQDLKSIFPNSPERIFKGRLASKESKSGFIELIEFGMEDVEKDISDKMSQLERNRTNGLSNLTTSYLKDVIEGEYRHINADTIEPAELQTIESVFDRIDERTLPASVKQHLREIVSKIRLGHRVEDEERVIALFLFKLLELHKNQRASESTVRGFIQICNKYLVGKELRYDDGSFTIKVHLTSDSNRNQGDESTISLKDLSSGEKQIVSLFSHLFLSDASRFFVLIDEPELSLSVVWQTTFLPDILSTQKCTGLVAVTHSPFIFQNTLDEVSHNLREFWV